MGARLEAFFLREWQQQSAWQLLLRPASWLYCAVVALRKVGFARGYFQSHQARVPVIVVGNISVGGTGKTPVVLALSSWLAARGKHPGIVTRGYVRGKAGGAALPGSVVHVIPPSSAASKGFSDEALLLAERSGLPVFAAAERVLAVERLTEKFPETDLVVCDDGLQHYALKRDVEIAVVDGARGFGNGHCLPAGPLREPIERLKDVDCVVLNNTQHVAPASGSSIDVVSQLNALRDTLVRHQVPVFEMTYRHERMIRIVASSERSGKSVAEPISVPSFLEETSGKKIAAMAGIGNPERFFNQLRALGVALSETRAFPDHHDYRLEDIRQLDADIILMTEKDAVKCREFAGVDERMWMMRVDATLPDAFFEFVLKKIDHVARP